MHLPGKYPQVFGKTCMRVAAVTLNWLEWLMQKGERNSRCYDFIEARPVWTKGWFQVLCAACIVCLGLAWFFWPVFG